MENKNLKKSKYQNSECNIQCWKQMHESINFQKTLEFKIFEKSRQNSNTDLSMAQSKTHIFEGGDFEERSEIPQVYVIQGQG